jgi:RimJ/RimL family protein N-acetyltransferase
MITLETERLVMRPFAEADLDAYAAMCADPEVMRFLGGETWDRMQTWRHIAATLGHWQLRGYGPWAVEEKASGTMVGRVGFINPEGWPGFELGWTLARSAWGHGFATEAAARALEHAFTEMARDHVISLIHPDNKPSLAVAERLGETFERTIELLGEEVGVYGISRQDWQRRVRSSR